MPTQAPLSQPKRILLAEDEPHLAFNITFNLSRAGFQVIHVENGTDAIKLFQEAEPFHLIILDIMIPEIDGFEVTKAIRKHNKSVGILILTARASEDDIIKGFELGADDYLTKPFRLTELSLRVKRMAERCDLLAGDMNSTIDTNSPSEIRLGSVHLDLMSLSLTTSIGTFQMTVLEAKVLAEFLNCPGEVLSRELLLKRAWGLKGHLETRTVDNFVLRLRKYLEVDPNRPKVLQSIRGRGYRYVHEEAQTR